MLFISNLMLMITASYLSLMVMCCYGLTVWEVGYHTALKEAGPQQHLWSTEDSFTEFTISTGAHLGNTSLSTLINGVSSRPSVIVS